MLFLLYYCATDSRHARARLPLALILALVTSVLIITWVLVYTLAIYKNEEVYLGEGKRTDVDGQEETHYQKRDKTEYIIYMIAVPCASIIFYSIAIFKTFDWVKRNERYRRSS